MGAIIRQKSLLEQAIQSNNGGTNPAVRDQLDIYSKAQVDSTIVDLSGAVSHGPATLSAVPSAFVAEYYISMKDANGSTFYVPAMSAAW